MSVKNVNHSYDNINWEHVGNNGIHKYKYKLNELLNNLNIPWDTVKCKNAK